MFFATNVASMGSSIAAAIGGQIAPPDKPVVALLGDSTFGMNGLEVHTAVNYNFPVIWVVLSYLTVFRQPLDVSAIAHDLEAHAFKALNLAEFEESLKQALALRAPCAIEAVVDLDEIPRSLQQRADTLKAFFLASRNLNRDTKEIHYSIRNCAY